MRGPESFQKKNYLGFLVQKNPTALWLNGITKQGAQSLRMKAPNAELYLKGVTAICGLQPLPARLSLLASKTKLLLMALLRVRQ